MSFPGIIRRLFANNGAGPKLRGDILPLNYGTCSTAAGTAAKVVSLPGFALATGAEVTVSFTVTNTASSPTLNVNGTGAKPIQYRNAAISAGYLAANRTYRFVYDGSSYELVGDVDTNTTYTAVTVSNFLLKVGAVVVLKFAYTNTAKSPTLNVSGTGPKGIFFGGAAIGAGAVIAGRTYTLVYDGVGWELVGDLYAQQVSDLIAELDFLRKLKIGAPRYHCSTTLPDRHAWINGDFIAFEDAPEFGEKYEAGGFDGMVMPWDADEEHQAAHLGQFRPDSANPTGLFLPVDGGQFFRNWGLGADNPAGSWASDAMRALTGMASFARGEGGGAIIMDATEGVFRVDRNGQSTQAYTGSGNKFPLSRLFFDSSQGTPTGPENVPPHVWQPAISYLGRAAQV